MEDQILDVNEDAIDYRSRVANKGNRFANTLVDSLLIGIPIGLLSNFVIYGEPLFIHPIGAGLDDVLKSFGINVLLYLCYYIFMEHQYGQTFGKMMTKTRVVNHQGKKPTLGQIIGRTFARYIPLDVFSFLGETGIGWHDSLSETYVIQE